MVRNKAVKSVLVRVVCTVLVFAHLALWGAVHVVAYCEPPMTAKELNSYSLPYDEWFLAIGFFQLILWVVVVVVFVHGQEPRAVSQRAGTIRRVAGISFFVYLFYLLYHRPGAVLFDNGVWIAVGRRGRAVVLNPHEVVDVMWGGIRALSAVNLGVALEIMYEVILAWLRPAKTSPTNGAIAESGSGEADIQRKDVGGPVFSDAYLSGESEPVAQVRPNDGLAAAVPMKVRINAVPPGEEPEEMRQCWVGLDLPLVPGDRGPRSMLFFGGISSPRSLISFIWQFVNERIRTRTCYRVPVDAALAVLEKSHPDAAEWWRSQAAHLIGRGMEFRFPQKFCDEIP